MDTKQSGRREIVSDVHKCNRMSKYVPRSLTLRCRLREEKCTKEVSGKISS